MDESAYLRDLSARPLGERLRGYTRLTGPGYMQSAMTLGGGTVFRVLRLEPNNAQRVHRTDSIDYAIVMSGEIDMELEAGEETHLKEGDVIVQRGTIHNWINRGTEPCQIAFVLIDAKPVVVNGKVLEAKG